MSSAHTRGPWHVDAKEAWVTQGTRDKPIAALLWPTELRSEVETMANARLIAAAPDMLEALQCFFDGHNGLTMTGAGLAKAKAAIAKATGSAQ